MDKEAILARFVGIYPEFKPLLDLDSPDSAQNDSFFAVCEKISCLYSEFSDLSKCCQSYPFLMLVAHYFVMGGFSASIGITGSGAGLVASSSVGDVSVSYQSNPTATKGDEFTYFLSQTRYGQEYLAWLKRRVGFKIV